LLYFSGALHLVTDCHFSMIDCSVKLNKRIWTKPLNLPVPIFGNRNGKYLVIISNFETRNVFLIICFQQNFRKTKNVLRALIVFLSVRPSVSSFISFLRSFSCLKFFECLEIMKKCLHFSSSQNSRWEQELFLVPKKKGLGTIFPRILWTA